MSDAAPAVSGLRFLATGLDFRTRRPLGRPLSAEELVDRLHRHLEQRADEVRRVTAQTRFAAGVRGERERVPQRDLGDPRAAGWTYLLDADDPDRDATVAAIRRLAEYRPQP